jgi:hypothetical protein
MDLAEIKGLIKRFAERHRQTFAQLSNRQYQLLELGSLIAIQQHYTSNGFEADVKTPRDQPVFVVKKNSKGHPADYSRISLVRACEEVELHVNLLVRGAHDDGIYCVDVGVVEGGVIPARRQRGEKWSCLANEELVSFAEVKRLRVYPMLLAQFLGIVHEIKPQFLAPPPIEGFGSGQHLPPTLIVLGHFSGNSSAIVKAYPDRGIQVHVAEAFDMRVAAHRAGNSHSPLFWDEEMASTDEVTLPTPIATGGATPVSSSPDTAGDRATP